MTKLLNDIDDLLGHLEDFTHGETGRDITALRHRIAQSQTKEKFTREDMEDSFEAGQQFEIDKHECRTEKYIEDFDKFMKTKKEDKL